MENEVTTRYATRQDAIEQYVVPALGDYGNDYDHDAIFEATFAYRADHDERGNEVLTNAGFERTADDIEFWEAVKAAEVGGDQL